MADMTAHLSAKLARYQAEVARARQIEALAIQLVEELERQNLMSDTARNLKEALDD